MLDPCIAGFALVALELSKPCIEGFVLVVVHRVMPHIWLAAIATCSNM